MSSPLRESQPPNVGDRHADGRARSTPQPPRRASREFAADPAGRRVAVAVALQVCCAWAVGNTSYVNANVQHATPPTGGDAPPPAAEPAIRPAPAELDPAAWVLDWQDEFEGPSLDQERWSHRSPGPRRDAFNVPEAISLDGHGHLLITTSKAADGRYLTGMIGTQGKYETAFGYFETRMKVQSQVGHWSAFWLQTPDMGQHIGDPGRAGVEIDIIEYLCNGPNRNEAKHAIHWDGYGEHHKVRTGRRRFDDLHDDFHTFGLLWTPTEYVFYVDGVETRRMTEAISHRPQYIILSLEVGSWAGDIRDATLPDSVVFDYVRVFKPVDAFVVPAEADQQAPPAADPAEDDGH